MAGAMVITGSTTACGECLRGQSNSPKRVGTRYWRV